MKDATRKKSRLDSDDNVCRLQGEILPRCLSNGYDDATKDGINGFFSNFLAYEYELDNAFGTHLFRNVDESVLEDERDISEFSEEERAEWSKETLIEVRRNTPSFSYGDIRRVPRICASN